MKGTVFDSNSNSVPVLISPQTLIRILIWNRVKLELMCSIKISFEFIGWPIRAGGNKPSWLGQEQQRRQSWWWGTLSTLCWAGSIRWANDVRRTADLLLIVPEPTVVERRYYDRARLPQNVPPEPTFVFDLSQKL